MAKSELTNDFHDEDGRISDIGVAEKLAYKYQEGLENAKKDEEDMEEQLKEEWYREQVNVEIAEELFEKFPLAFEEGVREVDGETIAIYRLKVENVEFYDPQLISGYETENFRILQDKQIEIEHLQDEVVKEYGTPEDNSRDAKYLTSYISSGMRGLFPYYIDFSKHGIFAAIIESEGNLITPSRFEKGFNLFQGTRRRLVLELINYISLAQGIIRERGEEKSD